MAFLGDLEDLPLQDILYVLNSRAKSGRLTLTTGTHEIILLLDKGRVAAVTSDDDTLRIGRLLIDQGYVTEQQMEQALALQEVLGGADRIGDILVEVGFVTRQQIGQAVAAQVEASLFRVLLEPSGTFSFTAEDSIKIDPFMDEIPIELMILNAVRMADEWMARHTSNDVLSILDTPLEPSLIDTLGEPEKRVLIALLNGVRTSHELAKATGLPAVELRIALATLASHQLIARDEDNTAGDYPPPDASMSPEEIAV